MPLYRTRLAGDIITEFLPPRRPSQRVVILCDGMPSVPNQKRLLQLFSRYNYWVFHPRYRGLWESGGTMFDHDPTEDILAVIDALHEPFTDVWERNEFQIDPSEVFVLGASFGGTAAIFASRDARVTKAIAIAPVIDWRKEDEGDEPLEELERVLAEGYTSAYRFAREDLVRLYQGAFYNPIDHLAEFSKHKLLIAHALDDTVVHTPSVLSFVKQLGCRSILVKTGGHVPGKLWRWWYRRQLLGFFKG